MAGKFRRDEAPNVGWITVVDCGPRTCRELPHQNTSCMVFASWSNLHQVTVTAADTVLPRNSEGWIMTCGDLAQQESSDFFNFFNFFHSFQTWLAVDGPRSSRDPHASIYFGCPHLHALDQSCLSCFACFTCFSY
jgi:hypothetical protein